jgi:penicillin-binding protein 1A
MLKEDKKEGSLTKMLNFKEASIEQVAAYRKILSSKEWPEIKKQYSLLRSVVLKQYNTPHKMKVFTWGNPKFEKDTMLSPMDGIRYHRMFLQTGILPAVK